MDMPRGDKELLEALDERVSYLQLSCNVRTLEGRKHFATFGYRGPDDELCSVGTVDGWTIGDCLVKVWHFMDQMEDKPDGEE